MKNSPLKKAALYASGSIAITLLVGIALVLVALYVPYNRLLHYGSYDDSPLASLLPAYDETPADLVLVRESIDTNENIAQNYDDPVQMKRRLDEEFKRQEGFSRIYAAKIRCQTDGPRTMMLNVVAHQNAASAERYLDFIKQHDMDEGSQAKDFGLGENGYVLFRPSESYCSSTETEIAVELVWTRENYLLTVSMSAVEGEYTRDNMVALLYAMAQLIEQRLSGVPGNLPHS